MCVRIFAANLSDSPGRTMEISMQMRLSEFVDFAKLERLGALLPEGVQSELFFHSRQSHGPALKGPWDSCTLTCQGFKTRDDAMSFWNDVDKRVRIGLNSQHPHQAADGMWETRIIMTRDNIARMREVEDE